MARLHTLAAADLVADADGLGRPAPAGRARLGALGELLTTPSDAPALVVAAVVHAELATIGAFTEAAGVVARGAARLTMVSRGLDPAGVSVPEVGHVELGRDAYLDALRGYATGGAAGVTGVGAALRGGCGARRPRGHRSLRSHPARRLTPVRPPADPVRPPDCDGT